MAAIIVVLIFVVSFYFYQTKDLYGNDKASIVKVINSIDNYKKKEIKVLGIRDFNDLRIVGFLSNNNPSYIEFEKNRKGNYEWRHIESREGPFSMFLLQMENSKMMFVTNYDNRIAKMQVDINGETLEQNFTPREATVSLVDLPNTKAKNYEYQNYRYYDEEGSLIEEY